MKYLLLIILVSSITIVSAQDLQGVEHFDKILIGPHIELELVQDNTETVTLRNVDVEDDEINIKVKGKTLMIYLDKARIATKHYKMNENGWKRKVPYYSGTKVKAVVTYKEVKKLSLRGEEDYDIQGTMVGDKVRVKMYGDGRLQIADIDAETLKVKLYGDHIVKVESGKLRKQKYKSYGQSSIDTYSLESRYAKSSNFGETQIKLQASEKIKFSSLGESTIRYAGVSKVRKGIVIGENEIRRIDK